MKTYKKLLASLTLAFVDRCIEWPVWTTSNCAQGKSILKNIIVNIRTFSMVRSAWILVADVDAAREEEAGVVATSGS